MPNMTLYLSSNAITFDYTFNQYRAFKSELAYFIVHLWYIMYTLIQTFIYFANQFNYNEKILFSMWEKTK